MSFSTHGKKLLNVRRGLVTRARLHWFDEPLAKLDREMRSEMQVEIRREQKQVCRVRVLPDWGVRVSDGQLTIEKLPELNSFLIATPHIVGWLH
jgi:ABC-type nitrate/sulfonate/bicarbonate transport system ATPase subunit